MPAVRARGESRRRRRPGTSSHRTGAAPIPKIVSPGSPAECMPTAVPGTRGATAATLSWRPPAWPLPAACFACACRALHVRRKFADAHRFQRTSIAEEAISRAAQLYGVEKEGRGSPSDQRAAVRTAKARPVLDDLRGWPHAQLPTISGVFHLARAARSALTRMKRFRPYLADGGGKTDDNTAERAMRAIALGRGNGLFVGSPPAPCRRHRVYPHRDRQAQPRRFPGPARRHHRRRPGPQNHSLQWLAPLAKAVRPDVCGRPFECRRYSEHDWACDQVRSCVRPRNRALSCAAGLYGDA